MMMSAVFYFLVRFVQTRVSDNRRYYDERGAFLILSAREISKSSVILIAIIISHGPYIVYNKECCIQHVVNYHFLASKPKEKPGSSTRAKAEMHWRPVAKYTYNPMHFSPSAGRELGLVGNKRRSVGTFEGWGEIEANRQWVWYQDPSDWNVRSELPGKSRGIEQHFCQPHLSRMQ